MKSRSFSLFLLSVLFAPILAFAQKTDSTQTKQTAHASTATAVANATTTNQQTPDNDKHSSKKLQDNKEPTVYITKAATGAKYHRAGCRYLRNSSVALSLSDAEKKYGPCSVCHPPTTQGK